MEKAEVFGFKFSQPKYLNTKITHIDQILRLVLFMVANGLSLRSAAALGSVAGMPQLSAVALHKWMKKIGDYIFWLLEEVSDCREIYASHRWGQYDVIATDATTAERPGATGTTARVHVALRLSTLRSIEAKVSTDKVGEHFGGFESMEEGQLWIGDRCYSNPESVKRADDCGAAVLVRYNKSSIPLYAHSDASEPIDVLALVRRLARVGSAITKPVWCKPKRNAAIRGRLHFIRLSAVDARRARGKLAKSRMENGESAPSSDVRELAGYRILFTTAPLSRLSAKQCLTLYCLRWQIELHFKREKSIAGLDGLPNYRNDTIDTWLGAKLLISELTRKLIAESGTSTGVSPNKKKSSDFVRAERAVAG